MATIDRIERAYRLRSRPRGSFTHRPSGNPLLAIWQTLMTLQARYSTRRALAELSDEQLLDVGLSRADLEQELRKPIWLI